MAARPSFARARQGRKRGAQEAGWRIPMVTRRQRMTGFRQVGTWEPRGRRAVADGVELKFHDIDWDEAAADFSAGVISNASSLVLIGQGVTESTRVGRKCVIKSIGWRAQLERIAVSSTGIAASEVIRLIIVQDKQANGAAPTVSGTGGLLESANYQAFNNLNNKSRFRVLYDKTFTLNTLAAAGDGTSNDSGAVQRSFSFFKDVNIPMEYSGTANPSVIGEVRTNNIFGIMISESGNSTVALDSKFRFRFSDG